VTEGLNYSEKFIDALALLVFDKLGISAAENSVSAGK
jgi:hypothetical protein